MKKDYWSLSQTKVFQTDYLKAKSKDHLEENNLWLYKINFKTKSSQNQMAYLEVLFLKLDQYLQKKSRREMKNKMILSQKYLVNLNIHQDTVCNHLWYLVQFLLSNMILNRLHCLFIKIHRLFLLYHSII